MANYQADIHVYFKEWEEVMCFDGVEDLAEKAGYYLEHEKERREIAHNGYAKVKQHHSYVNRIETILETIA